MRFLLVVLAASVAGAALLGGSRDVWAEEPAPVPAKITLYGPLLAGQQAHERSEADRRWQITRQQQLLDYTRWISGLPNRYGVSHFPSLAWVYSGSTASPYGYVFEPWRRVPGDIYGVPFVGSVRQPVGHRITPLGPNGYTYEPVYREDLLQASAVPAALARNVEPAPVAPPAAIPEEEVEPLPELRPDPVELLEAAAAAFRRGRYEDAVEMLSDSRTGEAALLRGQSLLAAGRVPQAAEAVHAALALTPQRQWGTVVARFRDYYADSRDYTEHLRALEGYVAAHPRSAPGRFLLGYHYGFLGHAAEAERQLQQAGQLAEGDPTVEALRRRFAPLGDAEAAPQNDQQPGRQAF